MNDPVSKVFQALDSVELEPAAYAALQLSADEVDSVVELAPKPAQQ